MVDPFLQGNDNLVMNIQTASIQLNQANVREQAAVQVQAMAIDAAQQQGAAVENLVSSVQTIADPGLGQRVDIIA